MPNDPNEYRYKLIFEGAADVERGPLGRFVDLAEQIGAEGGTVPPEITETLTQLTEGDSK